MESRVLERRYGVLFKGFLITYPNPGQPGNWRVQFEDRSESLGKRRSGRYVIAYGMTPREAEHSVACVAKQQCQYHEI